MAFEKLKKAFESGTDAEIGGELASSAKLVAKQGSQEIERLISEGKAHLTGTGDFMKLDNPELGDIVNNYRWSVKHPNQKYISQVPRILFTEYQPEDAPLLGSISYGANLIANTFSKKGTNQGAVDNGELYKNPYASLYKGRLTGNFYWFPFFSDYNHAISNTWDSSKNGVADEAVMKAAEVASQYVGAMQRAGVEERKLFTSTGAIASNLALFSSINSADLCSRNLWKIT